MQAYTEKFYNYIDDNALQGSKQIVHFVMELIKPKSVVDVGCGLGTWLAVFQQNGVEEILGIDGNFVDVNKLYIPQECFLKHDLVKPLEFKREFDLVVSLEVGNICQLKRLRVLLIHLLILVLLLSSPQPYLINLELNI